MAERQAGRQELQIRVSELERRWIEAMGGRENGRTVGREDAVGRYDGGSEDGEDGG